MSRGQEVPTGIQAALCNVQCRYCRFLHQLAAWKGRQCQAPQRLDSPSPQPHTPWPGTSHQRRPGSAPGSFDYPPARDAAGGAAHVHGNVTTWCIPGGKVTATSRRVQLGQLVGMKLAIFKTSTSASGFWPMATVTVEVSFNTEGLVCPHAYARLLRLAHALGWRSGYRAPCPDSDLGATWVPSAPQARQLTTYTASATTEPLIGRFVLTATPPGTLNCGLEVAG